MKLMQLVYPNLALEAHGRMMRIVFWLFVGTCAVLLASIMAIDAHVVGLTVAKIISQSVGPILSMNIALLFYLADQDYKAATAPEEA